MASIGKWKAMALLEEVQLPDFSLFSMKPKQLLRHGKLREYYCGIVHKGAQFNGSVSAAMTAQVSSFLSPIVLSLLVLTELYLLFIQ